MSQTQAEKQQAFREKLQTEGADSFADGPRPWEQWDESGNQHDNRIWEGTARRIHPKRKGARGFGDRLLSGLAVVALASMVVGVAGIYFSTPSTLSTPQQARTKIQPPPIMASRTAMPPATQQAESVDTAAPVLARLDTLPSPTAGTPIARDEYKTVLEPMMAAPRTAPSIQSDSIDKVAIETVITEETVTTTVYTRQLSQDEPELVAMVETTAPPFTHDSMQNDTPPVDTEPAVVEEAAEVVTEPTIVAQAEIADTEPAAIEEAAEVVTEPTIVAQAETIDIEPAVVEETAKPAAVVAAVNTTATAAEAAPDISRELETATEIPVPPKAKTGKWVINLSSYTRKPTAERMLAVFQRKGVVNAEVFTISIKDKPMHRIRVTGFESARSAKAEISALEQLLDIESAWVSKR